MNDIKEQHVCISKSNIKLGMIPSVSLPPIVTCSPEASKFCGKKCYARKICKLRPTVKESYENNLDILLNDKEYLERMVDVARKNKHCQILCFTKKYTLVNSYLTKHRLPKNLHLIFSVWKGLECFNPNNLPEAHVFYKDGTTTAKDGAKYCSGNCTECATENKNCWTLKRGEQILFKEH